MGDKNVDLFDLVKNADAITEAFKRGTRKAFAEAMATGTSFHIWCEERQQIIDLAAEERAKLSQQKQQNIKE